MNRVICVKGHFYDGDKYENCPHCAEGVAAIEPNRFSAAQGGVHQEEKGEVKKEKKGLFRKKEVKSEIQPVEEREDKTEIMHPEEKKSVSGPIQEEREEKSSQKSMQPVWAELAKSESRPEKAEESLSSAFLKAGRLPQEAPDEGKTIGFFSTGHSEPPVGYLICVEGEDYGMGFALKSGNNAIGRSQSMDVVVMDPKVSREKQAFVMYEPHKREFYIKPGESSGLCYFNDEVVLAPAKLSAFDRITVGETIFMLVPVCCDRFSWEDSRKQNG